MKKLFLILIFLPMLCFASSDNAFSGRWIHVKYKSMRVEVVPNGADYILVEYRDQITKKYPAKIVGSGLQVSSGPITASVVIEEKTGYLLYSGQQYRKLKSGEPFEYKKPEIPRF